MKIKLAIKGMHCNSCAMLIENELQEKTGIKKSSIDYASEKAEIEFDDKKISEQEITETIKKLGYEAK